MRVAVQAEDSDDARAFFALILSGDSPFDVLELEVEDEADQPFFAQMTVTVDSESSFFLRRAGLEYLTEKLAALDAQWDAVNKSRRDGTMEVDR
jgi:hypothetical protein